MSSVVIATPAGTPSMIPVIAAPWDSPAVSHLSMRRVFHAARDYRDEYQCASDCPRPRRSGRRASCTARTACVS